MTEEEYELALQEYIDACKIRENFKATSMAHNMAYCAMKQDEFDRTLGEEDEK